MHLFTTAKAVMNRAGGAIGIIMEVRCSIDWLSWLCYEWLSFYAALQRLCTTAPCACNIIFYLKLENRVARGLVTYFL
jgi:hypothetical protein